MNKIVQAIADLPDFSSCPALVLDTETSGLSSHHGDRVCGIAIGPFDTNDNYYLPIRHSPFSPDGYKNLLVENTLDWLRDLAKDSTKKWVNHNIKFDLKMLKADNIEFAGPVRDTMIMAHLQDGDRLNYSLDILTNHYLGFNHPRYEQLQRYLAARKQSIKTPEGRVPDNYSRVPIGILGEYALEDIMATRMLAWYLMGELDKRKDDKYANFNNPSWTVHELFNNEMELVKVIADMEYEGILVDRNRCATLRDQAENEVQRLNERMAKLCGFSFSPAAWTQLWKAFEAAGGQVKYWSAREKGKQKADKFTTNPKESTGRPCWNSIAILHYLQEYREKNPKVYDFVLSYWRSEQRRRILSSNLDVYLKECDFNGRLHGQFHQHGTLTGRMSSSGPNLQNIAKVKGTAEQKMIEKFLSEKDDDALNRQIRALFIAPRGKVLLSQDYSQIEYRAATYFSRDRIFIDKYKKNLSMDYHEETAKVAGIDRDAAKTVGFGILYGMGTESLASLLQVSFEQARHIKDTVLNTRPALRDLINYAHNEAFKGWVQNPFGRRCIVPKQFIYKGLNYMIQGTVGDMMRCAMVKIHRAIRVNNWPVRMLLTVHDELVYEVPEDCVVELAPKLGAIMCDCPHMPEPPIICDSEAGKNWGQGLVSLAEGSKT